MAWMNKTEEIKALLQQRQSLEGCRILTAYPFAGKPSLPTKPYLAVFPAEMQGEACALGESRQLVRCRVRIGIYVPQRDGMGLLCRLTQEVTDALCLTAPQEVAVEKAQVHDELGCFGVICSFVYSDAYGGNDG